MALLEVTMHRSLRLALAFAPVVGLSLACLAPVEGDRSMTGTCPEGERCSNTTPEGLTFVGQVLFDSEVPRLGPVVAGGTLEVGLLDAAGSALPAFEAVSTNPGVVSVGPPDEQFGPPTESGEPAYDVDAYMTLQASSAGEAFLRIEDPSSGELYDRTSILVLEVRDVELVNVTTGDGDHLLAGCDQMVGVRLLGEQDGVEIRAVDDSMVVEADGVRLEPELSLWDCVQVQPAPESASMRFDLVIGGRRYVRTMEVRTLASEGLTACPRRRD